MIQHMNYYVITPAKNEEKYITFILESMVNQELKPLKWIIVDDGSSDRTNEIISSYQKNNDWIEVIKSNDLVQLKLYGSKVIRAFNKGYNLVKDKDFDFIVKLDADLTLPPNYFKEISNEFSKNSKLGICGGYITEQDSDLAMKMTRHAFVEGAIKSVRKECFEAIGGFLQELGWDGLDQYKARYLGWEVGNIPIQVLHHRPENSDYRSLNLFLERGIVHYKQGNDLFLTLIRSVLMLKRKPYFFGSIYYIKGYLKSVFANTEKIEDKGFRDYLRNYHYKRLFKFKR